MKKVIIIIFIALVAIAILLIGNFFYEYDEITNSYKYEKYYETFTDDEYKLIQEEFDLNLSDEFKIVKLADRRDLDSGIAIKIKGSSDENCIGNFIKCIKSNENNKNISDLQKYVVKQIKSHKNDNSAVDMTDMNSNPINPAFLTPNILNSYNNIVYVYSVDNTYYFRIEKNPSQIKNKSIYSLADKCK